MRILVLGSGGREHAIAWKLSQFIGKDHVFVDPGNAGIESLGFAKLDIDTVTPQSVGRAASEKGVSLVIIGPEAMLGAGYGDELRKLGFLVVGPNRNAAQLETSKVFAKEFMSRAKVPTAPYEIAESRQQVEGLTQEELPLVLKLDGLAAGKGVVVATKFDEVTDFCKRVWENQEFGPGPHRVVVESCLTGNELSYMGFCDGKRFVPLSTATDYKRVGDGNLGANTGGMGSISPSPYFSEALKEKIERQVIAPVLDQMQEESLDFRGILYIGLMISAEGDPYVLEFNTRFGDPETQAILLRLESDFPALLYHTANGTLDQCPAPVWSPLTSVYVVAAAEGYPGEVTKGDKVSGLSVLPEETQLFFSGVNKVNGNLVTHGGRVLGLGALGKSAQDARHHVYNALTRITWRGQHYRKDIGEEEKKP